MERKEITYIKNNPSLQGMAVNIPDVTFSTSQGIELKMHIIKPWEVAENKEVKYPLIVFVQGSAWTFPDVNYQLPQLSQLAREGYVIATLTHRNCLDGHPFPAFLQDIKAGIRFLRKHANEYQIDADRIGIWGTSSGGNTALLVGLTGDDVKYKTEEYADYPDSVNMVIDCFGPTDIPGLLPKNQEIPEDMKSIFDKLNGGDINNNSEKLYDMSPVNHIQAGKEYPPFLIIQGDQDDLVDYSQSELMYDKLNEAGIDASMICVEGAPHEGSFWSNELLDLIKLFIQDNL